MIFFFYVEPKQSLEITFFYYVVGLSTHFSVRSFLNSVLKYTHHFKRLKGFYKKTILHTYLYKICNKTGFNAHTHVNMYITYKSIYVFAYFSFQL